MGAREVTVLRASFSRGPARGCAFKQRAAVLSVIDSVGSVHRTVDSSGIPAVPYLSSATVLRRYVPTLAACAVQLREVGLGAPWAQTRDSIRIHPAWPMTPGCRLHGTRAKK